MLLTITPGLHAFLLKTMDESVILYVDYNSYFFNNHALQVE